MNKDIMARQRRAGLTAGPRTGLVLMSINMRLIEVGKVGKVGDIGDVGEDGLTGAEWGTCMTHGSVS